MSWIIIVIGSVTTATRFKRLLESMGIYNVSVIHTPSAISGGNCSYSVRIKYDSLLVSLNASRDNNIRIKKIYREIPEEKGYRYDDIS